MLEKLTNPVIFCSFTNKVSKLIESGQYGPLNFNVKLAEELLKIPQTYRNQKANDEVMKIIKQCHKPTLLENYEILFDPRYNIDVIKVFTELARHQKVIVKWCGELNGNLLEYATPDNRDYHSFRIQDYNITCVI